MQSIKKKHGREFKEKKFVFWISDHDVIVLFVSDQELILVEIQDHGTQNERCGTSHTHTNT